MARFFGRKSIDVLLAEMAAEHQLHRVLGPVALTCLGIGAIIGAGIFVITGRVAASDAGPAIILSFVVASIGCAFAALCYAEFAAMAPVAGSAYTYAYATLGEMFAWIIGWDLILEYAMSCATVASAWSHYLNELLQALGLPQVPTVLRSDPFSGTEVNGVHYETWFNLPAVLIMAVVTYILVRGIRQSALTNAVLVVIKIAVVLFVIGVGWMYVDSKNWTSIPVSERIVQGERQVPAKAKTFVRDIEKIPDEKAKDRREELRRASLAQLKVITERATVDELVQKGELTPAEADARTNEVIARNQAELPSNEADRKAVETIARQARESAGEKWGMIGALGLHRWLAPLDDKVRSPFAPYGVSGIMLGAALVFFAYIGFDSISTHAEEARRPSRDVPIGIIVSLAVCTILYVAVAIVITGMVPYPRIDENAAIANAFSERAKQDNSQFLRLSTVLVSLGGLAGMTSVLLVTFLSQVRVFMAMSRDGLLPKLFGTIHSDYKTPHLATMLTGGIVCVVAAFTPLHNLAEMVNIGTLMAFVVVCAAVMILRIQRPEVERPFRCPALYIVAPLGILVNVTLMLFLSLATWWRLAAWLGAGMLIYFLFGSRNSRLARGMYDEIAHHGLTGSNAPPAKDG